MPKVILSDREACLVRRLCRNYVQRLKKQQQLFPFSREIEVDLFNYTKLLADKLQVWSEAESIKSKNHETKRFNFS